MQSRASGKVARRKTLPEYLDKPEVESLLAAAPNHDAELVMMVQWRAGLRIAEALGLEVSDLRFDAEPPVLRVRWQTAKGSRERLVPIHGELLSMLHYHTRIKRQTRGRLVEADASTAWRWVKKALQTAQSRGDIPLDRRVATHTLRHSAARHWLASGVPINKVSVWLGHASLQTTLIYLEILPDPGNDMERVP